LSCKALFSLFLLPFQSEILKFFVTFGGGCARGLRFHADLVVFSKRGQKNARGLNHVITGGSACVQCDAET
jgi:hypothetical protein